MSGPLADALFWVAVLAAAIAHVFILRSTVRGMRLAGPRAGGVMEWIWALLPVLALAVLFVCTWRLMHPEAMSFLIPADRIAPGGLAS